MTRRPPHPLMTQLRDLRLDRGLTQLEVASEIGVAQSALCFWENGGRTPTLTRVTELAAFHGYKLTLTPKEA
ncbi:helix-turn-helix transcriptional regulator [Nonomuraea sp. NPDC047897]|uniref:helix-turn-helix transcriptional regulator n=1 Tax=Nonomuraea sp. NPDC047897 TaxID=3364346 RepID=UPI00371B2056